MPRENQATLALNRGVLSLLALARVDLARYKMAAAVMVNWMARTLGSMMLRPGWGYIGTTAGNAFARNISFVFSAADLARIEVTQGLLRFWVQDSLVTRSAISTVVANGTFPTNLSSWTDASESGASVSWVSAGKVSFVGTGNNNAILDQQITPNPASARHALRIIVTRGPLTFRCGTIQGDDSYISETTLNTGTHSLAFTPPGDFWIRFENPNVNASLLASCTVEPAGILTLPAPWLTADIATLRWDQSADVVYIGAAGYQQMQIERRATDSWSIINYAPNNGPFRPINITNIALTPSAISGDITLTASKPLFKPGHLGALFRIISSGQLVTKILGSVDTYTDPILVTGIGDQRNFSVNVSGTFSGTLTIQYSVGTPGTWINTSNIYSTPQTGTIHDGLDNQTIYYRIGFTPGNYTSGSATASLAIPTGQITGIARVTGFTDNMHVNAAVLKSLGGATASTQWYEGSWSTFRGFPGTPKLWQGRLWWFGTSVFASVSDDYTNFDDTVLGDSGPIIGQLDSGAVDNIYWALGLQQLVLGTASAEISGRSTYIGDPITPTNFNFITGSTQGSANVNAVQMDRSGMFTQVGGSRVFSLELDIYTYSYKSQELTLLVPDFNKAGILQIAIQRKPDTRVHCLRTDGSVGIMVYDPTENVNCWLEVFPANGGIVEDISILPGSNETEDRVYYVVRRVVNGNTVRYHEKWALESECTGLPVAKLMDSHVVFTSASPTTTFNAVAPHLAGQTVCVWGWNTVTPYIDGNGNQPGIDLGTYVVAPDGTITGIKNAEAGPYPVTNAIIGLGYTAQWQSMKQAFAAAMGTPLNQSKRINQLGVVLQNTHARGVQIGNDFAHLDDLPLSDLPLVGEAGGADGSPPDLDCILNDYDHQMAGFNDIWSTDSRVCIQAASPRPASVLAFTVSMSTSG